MVCVQVRRGDWGPGLELGMCFRLFIIRKSSDTSSGSKGDETREQFRVSGLGV